LGNSNTLLLRKIVLHFIVGGGQMSRTQNASFTCPICGFSIKTPFGAEDAAEHIKLHADKHHNDRVTRAKISKTELIKLQ
jgi:hypothetical protein